MHYTTRHGLNDQAPHNFIAAEAPVSSTRLLLPDNSKDESRRLHYCHNSRFTLAGPGADPGTTRLFHAPCKALRCPYCGRVAMYQKRNRIYERIEQDRSSGLAARASYEFVTVTLRVGALSQEQAFLWLKRAVSYAIQQVRRPRKYNKSYKRSAWPGVIVEYINDVDITPTSSMPHVHALFTVSALPGADLPSRESITRELHYYLHRFLYRRLQKQCPRWETDKAYPFQRRNSLAYVHFSNARSNENCVMYMALHNGKIWTDGREYPRRFRRFATSRGYLAPLPEKEPSEFVFVKAALKQIAFDLAANGITATPEDLAQDGEVLAMVARGDFNSYRVQQALGARRSAKHSEPDGPTALPDLTPEQQAAKLAYELHYWEVRYGESDPGAAARPQPPPVADPGISDDQLVRVLRTLRNADPYSEEHYQAFIQFRGLSG